MLLSFLIIFSCFTSLTTVTAFAADDTDVVVGDYSVFTVGNGDGSWLNRASWAPAYAENKMTEVESDVWEIEYKNVDFGYDRRLNFAIDGDWTHSFNGVFEGSGVESDAVYDHSGFSSHITFDTENDSQTVKLRLDLRNFDFATKVGAKFTVTIIPDATAYAVYNGTDTLTFKCDAYMPSENAWDVSNTNYTSNTSVPWYSNRNNITKVVFDPSFADARPTSTAMWFNKCYNLTAIEGISNLNTSEVTNMANMFEYCSALTTLNVSNFNTSNVTNMSYMFYGCASLETIRVASEATDWSTGAVTDSGNMFSGCTSIEGKTGGIAYDSGNGKTHINYAKVKGGYFTVKLQLIAGHSLTLEGDIGVNFYIYPSAAGLTPADVESEPKTLTVDFEWAQEDPLYEVSDYSTTVTVDGTNYQAVGDLIKVTAYVCAAEMSAGIRVTADLNGKTETEVYSVRKYAETILDPESKSSVQYKTENDEDKYNGLVYLVQTMLDYGAKAQTVFNILPGDLANSIVTGYTMADVTSDMFTDAVKAANGNAEADDMAAVTEQLGMKYYSTSLIFLSKNTLRHIFAKNSASDTVDASKFDGQQSNFYYYKDYADIPAAELDTLQTFTIGDVSFKYSALDYAKNLVKSSNTSQANLAKALYWYNQATNAFFT